MLGGLSLLAAHEAGAAAKRHLNALALQVAAGFVMLVALVFALVGFHIWLMQGMTPWGASAVIAGGLLAVALVLIFAASVVKRRRTERTALTSGALVAAPAAARVLGGRLMRGRLFGGRLRLGTVALVAVVGLGALIGRQMARD
jgi:hypothetical protein